MVNCEEKTTTSHDHFRAFMIANNCEFSPARLDIGFLKWKERGLVVLDQLFDGPVLKSFEQLKEKYDLPNQDFF